VKPRSIKMVELVFLMPHMHVRGKGHDLHVRVPGWRKEIVLNVPHYDFNCSSGMTLRSKCPRHQAARGRALRQLGEQQFNPNPNRTVYYGEMTWEEMMFPFYGVVVDKDADPKKIVTGRTPTPGGREPVMGRG